MFADQNLRRDARTLYMHGKVSKGLPNISKLLVPVLPEPICLLSSARETGANVQGAACNMNRDTPSDMLDCMIAGLHASPQPVVQPEDAAKDINLKPPKFFVATTASQRTIDSPRGQEAAVQKPDVPPVVIISYGSTSTPTATNFHHGSYALARPEAAAPPQQVGWSNWGHATVTTDELQRCLQVHLLACMAQFLRHAVMLTFIHGLKPSQKHVAPKLC